MDFLKQTVCAVAASIAFSLVTAGAAEYENYSQAVRQTEGLLLHLSFDESDERADASDPRTPAPSLAGETLRGVDSAYPALGTGVRLSNGGYVRIPDLGEQQAISIELWLNPAKPPAAGIAGLYAADGWTERFCHFNLKSSGALELAINGVSSFPNTEPEIVTSGEWTYLVATYDSASGVMRLYRNGRMVMTETADPHPRVKLVAAAVGAWVSGTPSRPLEADLDEIAIYGTVLSPAQIRSHYNAARGVETVPVDFARDVRPIFEAHCFDCHGADLQESHLRLDVRDWALRGGESGEPAFEPFDADRSHLIQLVTSRDEESAMPPEGDRLSETEVAALRNWIDQGAPWPDELAGHAEPERVETSHWSFQPISKSDPPASDNKFVLTGNAIDAFILAKLHEKKLQPSGPADRRTLVRRLYLDVHGLPPALEQVQEFTQDESPQAWEKLVDRVLASPRYGERWASHWLDVVRYGDTHGFEVNTPREAAWPYRDYVIKSFNEDKPYDRFIREQLAGDQLGVDSATGFLVAAPALLAGQVGKDQASIRQARADELHEVIVSVSAGFMGLTVGCARCHNHKFDPISQRDYYQMQAFFAGLHYGNRAIRHPDEVRLDGNATPIAQQVFGGTFSSPDAAYRLYRGDPMQRRERVAPEVPAVLGTLGLNVHAPEAERRLALANALTDPAHPLTSRVIVNRIWQHHFGTGIVATPSDFGAMGFKPTHPELLDWLAASLVDNGWSLKSIHRLILLSNTYRQADTPRAEATAIDANSDYLWRFPPRRLEMEPIRDSILAVAGTLDLTMGGPGFQLFKANDNYVRVYDPKEEWGPGEWRRMIYAHRVRMAQDGVFGAFDCPDAGQPAPRRSRSTTALQALNLLNSGFIKQQAELLAARTQKEVGNDSVAQIQRMYELALARSPRESEVQASLKVANEFGVAAVARVLFNSNEFLFLP